MKILFVSLSPFDSIYSCSIRNQSLVSGLLQLGHSVDFLTVVNETGIERQSKLLLDPRLRILEINSVDVAKADKIKAYSLSYFGNLPRFFYHRFFLFEFIGKVVNRIKMDQVNVRNYDLIISSSDPKASHVFVTHLLKNLSARCRWIQYWGDPLSIDITSKSIYPMWYKKSVEGNLLKLADKVIYTSPFTLHHQQELFAETANKMFFIPTPYMEEKIFPKTENVRFVVGHHGYYISNIRNIEPLLSAFKIIGSDFELDLVGNTDLDLTSTTNVNVLPATGDIERFERRSDLLVVLLNKKGTQIPGKVFHMAGTNKPILVIVDGEHRKEFFTYFRSLKRYYVCYNNSEEIVSQIKKIRDEHLVYNADPQFSAVSAARQFIEG